MFLRSAFAIIGTLALVAPLHANSCSNVDVMGTHDQKGLQETDYQIYAVGTFRIMGETDESKQPMFNLAMVICDKHPDDPRDTNLDCKLTKAVVWANPEKPNTEQPNCSLDLDMSVFSMKELQRGILSGIETSSSCYDTTLTINKNTKRVHLSFTRTQYADNYDKTRPGTCGAAPGVQTMMNCTYLPRSRKQGAPPRYCDFSSAGDK